MGNRRQLLKYKGDACILCGREVETEIAEFGTHKRVFEFHHIDPSSKSDEYDNLVRRQLSSDILDELDKCVLVCNRCHDRLENQNSSGTSTATVSVTLEGRTVQQRVGGNILFNRVTNRLQFVTNERFKLIPYWLSVGNQPVETLLDIELSDGGRLWNEVLQIAKNGSVVVHDNRGQVVFSATHIEGDTARIECPDSTPFLKAELEGETSFLIQSGVAMASTGEVVTDGWVTMEVKLKTPLAV